MKHIMHKQTVTRDTQQTDVIYVVEGEPIGSVFVTPDGIGRYFYDSLEEAQEQHGDDLPVCYLEEEPDD